MAISSPSALNPQAGIATPNRRPATMISRRGGERGEGAGGELGRLRNGPRREGEV